jgi:site-specific DNA-methyltransferase (adenine-specific)
MTRAPGSIRDAILGYLATVAGGASISEITSAISMQLGEVSPSSVRSYLNLNTPRLFERFDRGLYRLAGSPAASAQSTVSFAPVYTNDKAKLYHADCFDWLAAQKPSSVHAVVTDPPYGLTEYTELEQAKLRAGRGGIWRIPPSFDGHQRAPLPRFTVLDDADRKELLAFFRKLGILFARVLVPGGNVIVASNSLLAHIVGTGLAEGGLELRGVIARLTMTMRGGDRPKNAHEEFEEVSVMPRSKWEPWVLLRKPLEGRVQDNLRKWKTGGFRRPSQALPFGDVIRSNPTSPAERKIAPHPSLKPQSFLRQLVRAALPLGEGVVLDPFAGSGSTLAAANAVGYQSLGVEFDKSYVAVAKKAIDKLSKLQLVDPVSPQLFDALPVERRSARA